MDLREQALYASNWTTQYTLNRQAAQAKASEIREDIALQRFDTTLDKYRPSEKGPEPQKLSTAEIFAQFMEHRRQGGTSGQAISSRYKPLLANIKRFGRDIETQSDAQEFVELLRSRQCELVSNQNLSLLKGFAEWGVTNDLIEFNPFAGIQRLRTLRRKNPKRRALKKEEIRAFLDAIKRDRYYHHYHDFCMAMFYLGIRPSEAVGLRWNHFDWDRRVVTVFESLSRGEDGKTAGYARQRKETKNHKIREIELHPDLYDTLYKRQQSTDQPDDLVFTTPKGNPIDDHSFSQRAWKRMCKQIGIDRVPYASRHSLGSHLIDEGATIPQVAEILGNTPETTARHYSHMINRPKMPGF